jgi:hypothetical protein
MRKETTKRWPGATNAGKRRLGRRQKSLTLDVCPAMPDAIALKKIGRAVC